MMAMHLFLLLSLVSFLSQGLSVFFVFKKVGRHGLHYRLFQLQFLGTWALFFYFSMKNIDAPNTLAWPASALLGACLILFFHTASLIRKNKLSIVFSEDSPEFHLARGPYQFVRHPFYTSYIFSYLALALVAQQGLVTLACASMLATYYTAARFEERKFLSSKLRPSYEAYMRTTGMFLPKILKTDRQEFRQ